MAAQELEAEMQHVPETKPVTIPGRWIEFRGYDLLNETKGSK